jgi:hypothetical protein
LYRPTNRKERKEKKEEEEKKKERKKRRGIWKPQAWRLVFAVTVRAKVKRQSCDEKKK